MGFFDEVDSIVINNKEVQSIISSDGGVIYEKSNGYELTLTSDKSIIQTGESATLSATLTNNNVPMAGETIFFYDPNNPPISYSTDGSHDFTVNVGDAFKLYYTSQSTASNSYCAIRDITNSISIYVHKEGNISIIETNISRTTTFNSFSYLKLENGILSNGDGDTCDLSSYTLDFDLVRINNSGTVYVEDDLIGVGTTNQNGVATVTYTGKGVGDIDVQADWNNTVQSNTITIENCIYYDATEYSSTHNYNWTLPSDNFIVFFEVYPQSRSECFPQLSIGENSNKFAWVGQGYHNGQNSMVYKVNNTTEKSVSGNTVNSLNEYTLIKYIYVNGEHNLIANNETITLDMDMIPQTLFQCYNSNSKIRNVKVKPLLDLSLSSF